MFPHSPNRVDLEQLYVLESLFVDLLANPCCYYAALTAAFHVDGLQSK